MKKLGRKTVLLACTISLLSLCMAFNSALGAGIKLGPGPEAVLKAYAKGDFDDAMKIMEKWKDAKLKFRTCDTKEFKEAYRHLYTREEFQKGTYDVKTVRTMLTNIQRIVDRNNCGK